MNIKQIVEKYLEFCKDKDEGYIYDETYEFLSELSRGDSCELMDYLVKLYKEEKL